MAAQAALFATIVHAVYAAIIREIGEKKGQARFQKVDRGQFAFNGQGA